MFRKTTSDWVLSSRLCTQVEVGVNFLLHFVRPEAEAISFLSWINAQRDSMSSNDVVDKVVSWPAWCWNVFMVCMIGYFVKSIFEQLAQGMFFTFSGSRILHS